MGEIKLKPCPFCGGEAFIHEICEDFLDVGWKMRGFAGSCKKCHATTEYNQDRNIAIRAWTIKEAEEQQKHGINEQERTV